MTTVRAVTAVVLLAILAASLVPSDNPSGEAIDYALFLRDGAPARINPNHLLIEPVIKGIYQLASSITRVDPLAFLHWVALLMLVAYALLMFRIGTLLFAGALLPFAIAVGCISSLAIVWFGTDGHPVLLAHLPLLLAAAMHLAALRAGAIPFHVAAGIAYGFSILLYMNNVFPVAVVAAASLFAFAFRRRRTMLAGERTLTPSTPFTSAAFIVPMLAAAVAGVGMTLAHARSQSPLSLFQWMGSYAGGSADLSYGGPSPLSLFRAAFGFVNALAGAQGAARLIRNWMEGEKSIQPKAGDAMELAIWAAALAAAGWLTALAVGRVRRLSGLHRAVVVVCLASALLVAIFNFVWIGSHPHFWVPGLIAIWIAWGFGLQPSPRRTAIVAAVCIVVILPWNVFHTLRPLRGDLEPKLRHAAILRLTPERSLIIAPGLDWLDSYGRYFTMGERNVLSIWRLSTDPAYSGNLEGYLSTIERMIDDSLNRGHPVFVEGILDERFPEGIPWREMEPRGFPLDRIRNTLLKYPSKPAFTMFEDGYRELTLPKRLGAPSSLP
jgi:hypothetical protein